MRRYANLFAISLGILVIACLLDGAAWAQIHNGTITGLVTDTSGGVVPNATVKITNLDTNVSLDGVTDSAGLYVAPNLLPGHYSVAVNLTGFEGQSKVGLDLSLSQTLTVNFTLRPGSQKQEVTVVGTAEQLVDPTTSTLGDVITEKPVQNLPLNGRNFMDLVPLSAGVTPSPPGSNKFYVDGSRGSATGFLIEGVDVSPPTVDSPPRVLPNLEAIGEFKITTNNSTAEYGRSLGGIVNAHIKSGTNIWHGSVFEYLRNTRLDARNFFDKPNRLPYHFNQFGGSLGGPIIKDKLFIFGDYQGTRLVSGHTVFTNVPTKAEDGGDFSDLLPRTKIYDPLTFPRTQFPNNVIPANRLDPASALMFSLMPPPNATGPFNFIVPQSSTSNTDGIDLRADYNPTSKDRLSFVTVLSSNTAVHQPILGPRLSGNQVDGNGGILARDFTLTYTRILSPSMVNEFTAGWTRSVLSSFPSPGHQFEPTLGIPGLNTSPSNRLLTGFPLFVPNGYTFLGGPLGAPSTQNHNIPQLSDNLSWVRGRHAFKTGFSAAFRQFNLNQVIASRGFYIFVPQATSSFPTNAGSGGNAVASALLGYPFQAQRMALPAFGERIKEYGAYFQDDFKATKRLALNLGVRWDLYMPSAEQFNRLANFDPSTVTMILAGQNGVSDSTLDVDKHNFSPHLGFSYQATSDGKTVVRGGYAIAYLNLATQEVGSANNRLVENPPFAENQAVANNPLGPVPPLGISVAKVSAGIPLTPQDPQHLCCGVTTYYIPQSQPMPYQQQWNLDIQRAIPGNFLLDVAYVGSRGVHLTGISNINQAPPGPTAATPRSPISPNIGQIQALMNRESSIYHALQVKLERRFTSGFYLMGSYTYSKSIDNGSIAAGGTGVPIASSPFPQDSFNWRAERGLSDFDLRHRMVVSYIYELPFGKGKKFLSTGNRAAEGFLGGWQVNGITTAQSGFPFTPELSNGAATINSGPGGPVRPYLVGNPNLASGQTINHWFNVAAFAVPGKAGTPAFTFGNAGRNILTGPGSVNFDFSMFKTFNVTERVKLEFRSEFFNIFNHPNFGPPNQAVDQPQAGIITAAAPPRLIQFALKLLF
jgi:Carboxypeptidase regulatory-like domain/TonB dependent receptor-like, beta-barrel